LGKIKYDQKQNRNEHSIAEDKEKNAVKQLNDELELELDLVFTKIRAKREEISKLERQI